MYLICTLILMVSLVSPMRIRTRTDVVGGSNAQPGQAPFIVNVNINMGPSCAGVIISETSILTSASCAQPLAQNGGSVVAGDVNTNANEITEQERSVSDVIVHEEFNSQTFENDIAILQLSQPLNFNQCVVAAQLPNCPTPWKIQTTGKFVSYSDGVPFTREVLCQTSSNKLISP